MPRRTSANAERTALPRGRPRRYILRMDPKALHAKLADAAKRFHAESIDVRGGRDPVAALYAERRAGYSLFALPMSDAECEALRPYLFGRPIPRKAGDAPVACLNLVDGEWRRTAELVADAVARRPPRDALRARALARGRLRARDRPGARVLVVARVGERRARLPQARHQELLAPPAATSTRSASTSSASRPRRRGSRPTRTSGRPSARPITSRATPRRRCAGELVPTMVPGQAYWKDAYLPAGVCTVITPMNFIYGIPGIQIVGCYLSGSPMIFKGHPFSAITTTTLIQMLLAAGRRPARGPQARGLRRRHRAARDRPAHRGRERDRQRRDGEDDPGGARRAPGEVRGRRLQLVVRSTTATRTTSSARSPCASPTRSSGSGRTSARPPRHRREQGDARPARADDRRRDEDVEGRATRARATASETKIVSPLMVHKASTLVSASRRRARDGRGASAPRGRAGHRTASTPRHAEVARPVVLGRVTPETQRRRSTGTAKERRSPSRRPSSSCRSWCTMEIAELRRLRPLLARR